MRFLTKLYIVHLIAGLKRHYFFSYIFKKTLKKTCFHNCKKRVAAAGIEPATISLLVEALTSAPNYIELTGFRRAFNVQNQAQC